MMVVLAIAPFVISANPQIRSVAKFSYENSDQRIAVRQIEGKSGLFFQSKMSCDVDGAPNAYHAWDDRLSLDVIGSAEGTRFGNAMYGPLEVQPSPDIIVYDSGKPYVQTSGEYSGFLVSGTSLYDPKRAPTDTSKYLDSRYVQYIVLPGNLCPGAQVGDLAAVYDPDSKKVAFAVFGDVGPETESGEASLATLKALGFPVTDGKSSPAEYRDDLFYVVFPKTSDLLLKAEEWPHPQSTIDRLARDQFEKWGGVPLVQSIINSDNQGGSVSDTDENHWIYDELAFASKRGWIKTVSIGLPDRLMGGNTRLPCAPEIVLAARDAIRGIQTSLENAEIRHESIESDSSEFHLKKLAKIIENFPDAAGDEGISPDQIRVRVDHLVTRLASLPSSSVSI